MTMERMEASSELRRVVAGPPAMPAALVPVGAARLVGSGPPSSAGTGPVEVEQLLKELFGIYDPVKEDLSEYLERITRFVSFEDLGSQRVGCGLGADYDE